MDAFVAREGFSAKVDGEEVRVAAGERVREGHPLIAARPEAFDRDDRAMRGVEQMTSAPGERRGNPKEESA